MSVHSKRAPAPRGPAGARGRVAGRVGAALAGALLALGLATPALADQVDIVGAATGQSSTATVFCEFNAQTNTLTFTATNTSGITDPGSTSTITAFGFDLPPTGNASATGLNGFTGNQAPSLSSDFSFSDADLGAVPVYPSAVLDFGFITDGSFADGTGDDGLVPGESASFTVSGAAFSGFTEEQLCNALFVRFEEGATGDGTDVGVPQSAIENNVVGIAHPTLATANVTCSFNAQTNTLTFTVVNTSPFDARITGIGFDLPPAGNLSRSGLNGFTGSAVSQPDGVAFRFSDAALGKVPQVSGAVLDFGFVTGKNFAGGKSSAGLAPGLDPGDEATFVVSGAGFAGHTEDGICDSIVLRFQHVGADGLGGDVAVAID